MMPGRVVNALALTLVGVVVVAGLGLYLRAGPPPGTDPSASPGASATVAPSDSVAPSESPTASVTAAATESVAPSESPSESPTLTPSPEPTPSPPAGSLEEFLASIAAPVVAEIDGKPEWVIARDGSFDRLAPADDVTRAFYRNGVVLVVQPRGEEGSAVRVLGPTGQELASVEVPAGGPDINVFVTRDRRLAYVMDDRSILRVNLATGEYETLHEGPTVSRGQSSLSPSGNTLASPICNEEECDTQLITGDPGVVLEQFVLLGASDEYLVGFESLSARHWLVYSIADRTRGAIPVPQVQIAWDGYALDDGRFVITGSNDQDEWSMWIFDPVADTVSPVALKDIEPRDIVVYDDFLPSSRWAVIGPTQGVSLGETLHVVDLETGHTVAEVVLGP